MEVSLEKLASANSQLDQKIPDRVSKILPEPAVVALISRRFS